MKNNQSNQAFTTCDGWRIEKVPYDDGSYFVKTSHFNILLQVEQILTAFFDENGKNKHAIYHALDESGQLHCTRLKVLFNEDGSHHSTYHEVFNHGELTHSFNKINDPLNRPSREDSESSVINFIIGCLWSAQNFDKALDIIQRLENESVKNSEPINSFENVVNGLRQDVLESILGHKTVYIINVAEDVSPYPIQGATNSLGESLSCGTTTYTEDLEDHTEDSSVANLLGKFDNLEDY